MGNMKSVVGQGISRRKFLGNAALAALAVKGNGLLAQESGAVVKAPCGSLRGEVVEGVRVFRGVPFAEPPVGALRFKAPVKMKAWSGERDATKFAAAAMQTPGEGIAESEDCLYLNVYTPAVVKASMPVLVWIHGGGFTGGHSPADGVKFARDGVVFVSVAYRLGVFGFMDFAPLLGEAYAGSANNAVRDLIAELEWVRENIAAFGGDPARVTIGGQSAGGKLTDILLGVPSAEGLFEQGISESGGAERVWSTAEEARAVAKGFGEEWRKETGKENAGLMTAEATDLIAVQRKFIKLWPHRSPLKPAVDGVLLTKLPVEAMAAGLAKGKRLLIGSNREESAAMIGAKPKEVDRREIGGVTPEEFDAVEAKYKAVYPEMTEEQRRIRALTAEEYWVPSVRCADALTKGGGRVWMYLFEFAEGGKFPGFAYHSAEEPLAFGGKRTGATNVAVETELAAGMHPAWVAFVRGEMPAGPGLPVWPEYTSETRPTMVFDAKIRVEMKPQEAELRLWDGLSW